MHPREKLDTDADKTKEAWRAFKATRGAGGDWLVTRLGVFDETGWPTAQKPERPRPKTPPPPWCTSRELSREPLGTTKPPGEMPRETPEDFTKVPVEQETPNTDTKIPYPYDKIKVTKEPSCTPRPETSWRPELAHLARIAKEIVFVQDQEGEDHQHH